MKRRKKGGVKAVPAIVVIVFALLLCGRISEKCIAGKERAALEEKHFGAKQALSDEELESGKEAFSGQLLVSESIEENAKNILQKEEKEINEETEAEAKMGNGKEDADAGSDGKNETDTAAEKSEEERQTGNDQKIGSEDESDEKEEDQFAPGIEKIEWLDDVQAVECSFSAEESAGFGYFSKNETRLQLCLQDIYVPKSTDESSQGSTGGNSENTENYYEDADGASKARANQAEEQKSVTESGDALTKDSEEEKEDTKEETMGCDGLMYVRIILQAADGSAASYRIEAVKIRETENVSGSAEKSNQRNEANRVAAKVSASYQAVFSLPSTFRGRVWVSAEDCCGNESGQFCTEGIILEGEDQPDAEVLSLSAITNADGRDAAGNALYRQGEIELQVRAADSYAGLGEVFLEVEGGSFRGSLDTDVSIPLNAEKNIQANSHYKGWEILQTEENLVTDMQGNIYVWPESREVYVRMYFRDRAGQISVSQELHLQVDGEAPLVEVAFDKNTPENELYYQTGRIADIKVHERNFDQGHTFILAYGANGAVAKRDSWEMIGKDEEGLPVYENKVEFSEDDAYTFHIYCSDAAGNTAGDITYAKGTRNPQQFIIDSKVDEIEIEGAEDGAVYSGSMQLSVTLADQHIKDSQLQIFRQNVLGIKEDITYLFPIEEKENTKSLLFTWERDREWDGCFCLQAKVSDLAGNQESREIYFTVNRFGSLFWLDGALEGLNHQYVQSVENDLLVYEKNPSGVERQNVQIEILRNGEKRLLGEEVMQELSEKGRQEKSYWHVYRYILEKAYFQRDGIYQISVSSEDQVGNFTGSWQNADHQVTFCVDSTAPVLRSVTGLEKEKTEKKEISFSALDSYGLASVVVEIDGKTVLRCLRFSDGLHYNDELKLEAGEHHLRFILTDLAGNVLDTDARDQKGNYLWTPDFDFCRDITVSETGQGLFGTEIEIPFHLPFSLPFQSESEGDIRKGQAAEPGQISVKSGLCVVLLVTLGGIVLCRFLRSRRRQQLK